MNPDAFDLLYNDPDLRPLLDEHGELSVEPAADSFQRFLTSIINQQLSSASASAIRDRVFSRFEVTPHGIIAASDEALRETGLSRQKVQYINNIADVYAERNYGYDYFEEVTDDEVIAELTQIHGVGTWTAKMYLMFCLGREDVFPVEDLGIRNGMWVLYGEEMDREEMTAVAEKWHPFRSYAARYLWRVTDG